MPVRRTLGLPADRSARRIVVVLAAMTLLLWLGGSSIVPLLPTYLRAHGGSPALIGVVMASYYGAAVLTQYPVGRLTDRFGSRAMLAGGLGIFVVGSMGFAFVHGVGPAIAFRGAQGIGGGASSVAAIACVARRVAPEERGRSFAFLYGAQNLAFASGPLLGGILGVGEMRVLFVGAAALGLAGLVLVVALFPNDLALSAPPPSLDSGRRAPAPDAYRRALLGALATFGAIGVLAGLYDSTWSLLLHARHASSFEIGLSWTLYCLPYAACSAAAGRLADRANRRALALVGMTCSALFALLYPELHSIVLLLCFGSAEAIGAVVVAPAALSMAAEWTAEDRHGAAQGALETARTATTALAAAACGALFGVAIGLPFLAAACALGTCLLACGAAWRRLPGRAGAALSAGAVLAVANREVSSGAPS